MNEIIRLENVIKLNATGRRIIKGISLCVSQGEHVAVHGAPGSGKAMLMRLITGMERPSDGRVYVLGKAVHEMSPDAAADFRNRVFGLALREPCLMPSLTVWENVALPLAIRGQPLSRRKKSAIEQLKTINLGYAAHAYPPQLSAYEAQLASIARAWITRPKILLLDDITADLSSKENDQIIGTLNALWQFGDCTVLCFIGNHDSVVPFDKLFILDYGKLQEEES